MALTLNEMCKLLGVSRRAVQGYEKAELVVASGKNKYGYLLYDEEVVEKVKNIKQYQDFGFSIKEIKELLISSDKSYVDMMLVKVNEMKKKIMELEENIAKAETLIADKTKQ